MQLSINAVGMPANSDPEKTDAEPENVVHFNDVQWMLLLKQLISTNYMQKEKKDET